MRGGTGVTISDIAKMDISKINSMSKKELSFFTSRLVSASNKRINRLAKSVSGRRVGRGFIPKSARQNIPALASRTKLFSIRGKNINQIRNTFVSARDFLNRKTSTVTGYKKIKSEMIDRTGLTNKKDQSRFWKYYNMLSDEKGASVRSFYSTKGKDYMVKILKEKYSDLSKLSDEEAKAQLVKIYKDYYEANI